MSLAPPSALLRRLLSLIALALSVSLAGAGAQIQPPTILTGPEPLSFGANPYAGFFRYQRSVTVRAPGQACLLLDAAIYPHAAPFLKDLRLFSTSAAAATYELPYVLTLSQPQGADVDTARVLNLGLEGKNIVFDLAMPDRNYTDVTLNLNAHDFLATAHVFGFRAPAAGRTALGAFTLFDLSIQHLSRSTTLHLQELNFPFLHVVLALTAAPGAPTLRPSPQIVAGAEIPPSREAQTLFTPSVTSTVLGQRGRQTVALFNLPRRLPVERVSVLLAPGFTGNFSRDIHITARALPRITGFGPVDTGEDASEILSGTIRRVHLTEAGRDISEVQLSVPAVLGANLQQPATVEVAIDNGDDAPLPIAAVQLEMRQRKLCFDARSPDILDLFYGDPGLAAPVYDFVHLFQPTAPTQAAQLGPEQRNAGYRPRPAADAPAQRSPQLLWIALLIAFFILGLVAFRSARSILR